MVVIFFGSAAKPAGLSTMVGHSSTGMMWTTGQYHMQLVYLGVLSAQRFQVTLITAARQM